MQTDRATVTITFGDQAENHAGMQRIGSMAATGFDRVDLDRAQAWFAARGVTTTLHRLKDLLGDNVQDDATIDEAHLLVAHRGLAAVCDPDELLREQLALPWDSKAFMYGRVVNKHARHNLCFDDTAQEPDYAAGRGRIVSYASAPLLARVRTTLPDIVGDKAAGLMAEGNHYYDATKCGIGYHGDGERRRVVAVRTGATLPLCYQWYKNGQPQGRRLKVDLAHGDVYIMSAKAVGTDWKRRSIHTLRHAAGADKFIRVDSAAADTVT